MTQQADAGACPSCFRPLDGAAVCPHCGWSAEAAPEPDALPPGAKLGGEYRLGGVLRRTGRSIFYRGFDDRLAVDVVVEEVFPEGLAQRAADGSVLVADERWPRALDQLRRETRRLIAFAEAAELDAPFEVREERGTHYRLYRAHDGITLEAFLARRAVGLGWLAAMRIAAPVVAGLAAFHEAGEAHGAVSPESILLLRSGQVKLRLAERVPDALPTEDVRALAATICQAAWGLTGTPPPSPDDLHGAAPWEREALLTALGASPAGKSFADAGAFRAALAGPSPPPEPPPIPGGDETPTRVFADPEADDEPPTRIVGSDDRTTVIVPQPGGFEPPANVHGDGQRGFRPRPAPRPSLTPVLLALAAIPLLAVLGGGVWWLASVCCSPDSPGEIVQQNEGAQGDEPPPEPRPQPDPAPYPVPDSDPEPEAEPSPDRDPPAPLPRPSPQPPPRRQERIPAPRPQPAPAPGGAFDARLAGEWATDIATRAGTFTCLLRIEGNGAYFLDPRCPGELSGASGRLETREGSVLIVHPARGPAEQSFYTAEAGVLALLAANLGSAVWQRASDRPAPRPDPSPRTDPRRERSSAPPRVAPSPFPAPAPAEPDYDGLVSEARRARDARDFRGAQSRLQQAARLAPNRPEAHEELFALALNPLRDLALAEQSAGAAMAAGGELRFTVLEEGERINGTLSISSKRVRFRPAIGRGGFDIAPGGVREFTHNRGRLRGIAGTVTQGRIGNDNRSSFRVRVGDKRYNFIPHSGDPHEADLIVRLGAAVVR